MAPPSDNRATLSNGRPGHKKLQNIGISQFKRQGVALHFQPNSATALLNQQIADQRTEIWLGRGPSTALADVPQGKAKGKGKGKVKNVTTDKAATATATAVEAVADRTTSNLVTAPKSEDVHMAQDEATVEAMATHKTQGTVSAVAKAPRQKLIRTIVRRVKPAQGIWGQRIVENAKKAAPKVIATTHPTTAITITSIDGELNAIVEPKLTPSTPKPTIPVQPKRAPTKTALKSSIKARPEKKPQAPMWSDSSDNGEDDHDESNDFLFSSTSVRQIATSSTANEKSQSRRRASRAQALPQQRKVRFASAASSPEGDEINSTIIPQQKQANRMAAAERSTTNTSRSPSHTKENLDPGELSDDEDSELHVRPANASRSTTPAHQKLSSTSASNPAELSIERRKKGVAAAPMPKRARALDTDNDNNKKDMSDAAPLRKKAKTSPTPRGDLPMRKKGVATKPVHKKKRPIFSDESDA